MLSVNTRLPDTLLEQLISQRCSDYGKVERVFILRSLSSGSAEVYALVQMTTPESVLALRRSFGDMMYGNTSVYIGLSPSRFH
jgi:hypothetical protein